MIIKDKKIYLIHEMSTWYCKTGNVKLFFKIYILYFSKYRHPKKCIFWLFYLIIHLYIYTVDKIASPPHRYSILFCSLMCFRQSKTKTDFNEHFLYGKWHSKGKMCTFSYTFLYKLAEPRSAILNILKALCRKSSLVTLSFYDRFFLTLVLSYRITQKIGMATNWLVASVSGLVCTQLAI